MKQWDIWNNEVKAQKEQTHDGGGIVGGIDNGHDQTFIDGKQWSGVKGRHNATRGGKSHQPKPNGVQIDILGRHRKTDAAYKHKKKHIFNYTIANTQAYTLASRSEFIYFHL